MNKNDFMKETAKRCNLPTYMIEENFNVMAGIIAEKLIAGETVELPKLGRFYIVTRKEMVGKNLFGTSEKRLEACVYPSFKISAPFKTRVKNGCKYHKSYEIQNGPASF